MRQVIFNGDDFGISSETNHAIIKAHRSGVLTSASLMVNGPAFEEAVQLARANPGLSVGIHLVLVQGRATLPPEEIPGLVDRQGNFRNNPLGAGMAYFFLPALAPQIKNEVKAQIEKFLATGIPLAHLNGHLHIHVHPTVLEVVRQLAARYGIKAVRVPLEKLTVTLALDRSHWCWKVMHWSIFQLLSRYARRRLKQSGFRIPDRHYGLLQSGHMTEPYLTGLLEKIGDGNCEIAFHLGSASDWPAGYEGHGELSALLSRRIRSQISAYDLKLINYTGL